MYNKKLHNYIWYGSELIIEKCAKRKEGNFEFMNMNLIEKKIVESMKNQKKEKIKDNKFYQQMLLIINTISEFCGSTHTIHSEENKKSE